VGSAIWLTSVQLKGRNYNAYTNKEVPVAGHKLAWEFPLLSSSTSRKHMWSELQVKVLAKLKDFLNHLLFLAIFLFVLLMDVTAHKDKHSQSFCFFRLRWSKKSISIFLH